MESPDVAKAIKILESLPPMGARRTNFSRRYLKDRISVLGLPLDPDSLGLGYWW